MKIISLVLFCAVSLSVFAQKQVSSVPDWYKNPPKMDAEKVYGVGKGKSLKMSIASQKAMLSAKESIAFQINPPKKKRWSLFFWRKSKQDSYVTPEETITKLKNIEIVDKVYMQNKEGYVVYILLKINREDAM